MAEQSTTTLTCTVDDVLLWGPCADCTENRIRELMSSRAAAARDAARDAGWSATWDATWAAAEAAAWAAASAAADAATWAAARDNLLDLTVEVLVTED